MRGASCSSRRCSLLDEPLGALDLKLREHMKIELKELQASFGTTFVYITHDQSEALVLSDHVAVMSAGRFEQVGTPQELYYHPATPFVAAFVGENNRVEGNVLRVDGDIAEAATATGMRIRARRAGALAAGDKIAAFIRPESIVLARTVAALPGIDAAIRQRGREPALRRRQLGGAGARGRVAAHVPCRAAADRRLRGSRPRGAHSIRLRSCARRLLPRGRIMTPALVAPRGRLALLLLLAPALVWLVGLIVLPHVELAILSLRARVAPRVFEWSLAQYRTFFEEPLYWHTFVRTATMSILATLCTLAIAFPVAWYIAKIAKGRSKSLLFVLCLIPFWVSETVRTLGWMILLRESGVVPRLLVDLGLTAAPVELLYHDATILVGLVYTSMLFMVVPLVNALETLDDSLIEAAYDLGGSGWSILRKIVIPHAAPGIAAGAIVVFMLTLGNYLTPTLLGGKNSLWFTETIYTQFITRFNWEQGAAFGFLLLALSTAIVWLGLKLTGQRFADVMRRS